MLQQNFFAKLIPPRPTFARDMSTSERALMEQHGAYIAEHFEAGRVLAYGPVFAPEGSFGFAVLATPDEAEAHRIFAADPTIQAGLNTYQIYPMRLGGSRAPDPEP